MLRTLTAVACSIALAALAGCGESEQEQAREVVQDYAEARNAGDFEAVCELFSERFVEQLGTDDCPAFIEEQTAGADGEQTLEVVDVRVSDEVATAELDVVSDATGPSRVVVRLEEEDGEWRIVGLQ
jgi:ketosteroid isomerase-like protein